MYEISAEVITGVFTDAAARRCGLKKYDVKAVAKFVGKINVLRNCHLKNGEIFILVLLVVYY